MYFSTAADAWEGDSGGPCIYLAGSNTDCHVFKAAKRALYITLRHQHLTVDVLNEQDVAEGRLTKYARLYVTDPHVSLAATVAIAGWVERGGTLFATASAGLYDEGNARNAPMAALLGLDVWASGSG
jgi:hypothetical protein